MSQKRFQFHNGSIKSKDLDSTGLLLIVFQFHNGSIKRPFTVDHTLPIIAFQFHNGSIKSQKARQTELD